MFDLEDFLRLCIEYAELGNAIQEQLNAVASGRAMEDQNSNALKIANDWLNRVVNRADDDSRLKDEAEELRDKIRDYLKSLRK